MFITSSMPSFVGPRNTENIKLTTTSNNKAVLVLLLAIPRNRQILIDSG